MLGFIRRSLYTNLTLLSRLMYLSVGLLRLCSTPEQLFRDRMERAEEFLEMDLDFDLGIFDFEF